MQSDEEGVYCNLYRIDAEYLPKVHGRDEMGGLPHWHIGARELAAIEHGGVAALWNGPGESSS